METITVYFLLISLSFMTSDARRVRVDDEDEYEDEYNRVGIKPGDGKPIWTLEEHLRKYNYSSADECNRVCTKSNSGKTCYYRFYLENYATLTTACDSCTPNRTTACQCVLADGVERSILSVNRMIPGPSIEVCEGDKVIIDVVNEMIEYETTIHWHGVHQYGTPYFDGVPYVTQCPILSSNTFQYVWYADPPGTHFWHSHSGLQKFNGISGSLIVRQKLKKDPQSGLYDFDLSEHVVFVQDWTHVDVSEFYPGRRFSNIGQMADNFLINGKGLPDVTLAELDSTSLARFTVQPGKRYRFRFINAFASVCPVQLSVEGHNLTVIALDGEPVIPVEVGSIISASGERYDFIISSNQIPRSYWIRLNGLGECAEIKIVRQVAVLQYFPENNVTTPTPSSSVSQTVLNPLDSKCNETRADATCVSQLRHVKKTVLERKPDVKIFLPFRFYAYNDQELFQSNTFKQFFVAVGIVNLAGLMDGISYQSPPSPLISQFKDIDKKIFCNGDQPYNYSEGIRKCTHLIKVPLHSTVELILVDEVQTPYIHHPFHLHGFGFHILGVGTMPESFGKITLEKAIEMDKKNLLKRRYGYAPIKDTIKIPKNGYVVLRFEADNPGFWLLHCHFLVHLDSGMAAVLQVGDLTDMPPIPTTFPKCGNFEPLIK